MQFEGTLEFPREKQVDESSPGTGLSTVLGTVTPATSTAAAPGLSTVLRTVTPATSTAAAPGLSTVLGTVTPATSTADAPGLSTSLETASPTTEVKVEQTKAKDGEDETELKVTVVDRESTEANSVVITSESSASTSPRTVSTGVNSVVITSESSASTSPRSVSTKASPEVIPPQSPASPSYSSPGSTTTMISAWTTKMLPVKSSAVWSTKDMMMTLHLGAGLWLLILSGGAMCVGGTLSLLWVRLGALQDQLARFAPPAQSVNV